ncbi:MAG: oxidoreductase [Thermoanaerobacteraceae bacterium]|nr:oxidoreductase [Thermoanaerobacteraceae bacterium]
MSRIRIILNWGASCGGCDVSILDVGRAILDLPESVEILYWPVALDFKRQDLENLPDGSVDVGIINGAVRTAEQEEEARIFRTKCKQIVAYGSCACFGGIPGLANQFTSEELLQRAYFEAPSNVNEEGTMPQPVSGQEGFSLTLPEFLPEVRSLEQVVPVDCYVPGCPPSNSTIMELLGALGSIAAGNAAKKVLASDKALCYDCPRGKTKEAKKAATLYRPHEIIAGSEHCLLEQGIVCLGFATRGGCGARCINVNMPCRGCYGWLPAMSDPGAEAMSAIASITGEWEDYLQPPKIMEVLEAVKDAVGIFYPFSLPSAIINRKRG